VLTDAPRVTVLADPDDSSACLVELMVRHCLIQGVVVCLPQPGTGARSVLGADLLVALGKLPGAAAMHGRGGRAWDLAGLWLAAERVTQLVVLRADRLPPARWADLAALAATAGTRLWLTAHGGVATHEHQHAVAAVNGGRAPTVLLWRAGLATRPRAEDGGDEAGRYPAVPDVEFPRFRATARRLLPEAGFARVDTVYRDTFARAQAHAEDLRLSLLSQTSRADLIDAVLQQLTIDATSIDEVLTRVRAAQAGLFAEGLFVDLCARVRPTWGACTVRLEPRLDPPTVARIRGLEDPGMAATVVLSRATGLSPARLRRLRDRDVAECSDGGLHVRHSSMLGYRVPPGAAGLIRGVLPDQRPPTAGTSTSVDGDAFERGSRWLFTSSDGVLLEDRAVARLRDQGAARAGIALPGPSFRNQSVIDLRGPFRVGA
jgi:hypothetical protein